MRLTSHREVVNQPDNFPAKLNQKGLVKTVRTKFHTGRYKNIRNI